MKLFIPQTPLTPPDEWHSPHSRIIQVCEDVGHLIRLQISQRSVCECVCVHRE